MSVRLSLRYFEDGNEWRYFPWRIGRRIKSGDLSIPSDETVATITHKAVMGNRRRTKTCCSLEAVPSAVDANSQTVDRSHRRGLQAHQRRTPTAVNHMQPLERGRLGVAVACNLWRVGVSLMLG